MINTAGKKELIKFCEHAEQSEMVMKMDATKLANSNNPCFEVCATSSSIPFPEDNPKRALLCAKGEQVAEEEATHEKVDERKKQDLTMKCQLCLFEVETAEVLEIHFQIHSKTYQCHRCPYGANRKVDMDSHTLLHDRKSCFVCAVCGYRCVPKNHMTLHMITHSGDLPRPFRCSLCPYTSVTKYALNSHMKTHNAKKPFGCAECPFRAFHKASLRYHVSTKHSAEPKPKQCFTCTVCYKNFSSKSYFNNHVKNHTGDVAFHCAHCTYKTPHKSVLVSHVVKHMKARDHRCGICSNKYKSKMILEKHIEYEHNGIQPFKPSSSSKPPKIIQRPFLCRFCSFSCSAKSSLSRHEKRHSVEKPYPCPQCGKKYKHKRFLDAHQQTDRLACHLCSFKCCGFPLLVSHIRSSHVPAVVGKPETAALFPNV